MSWLYRGGYMAAIAFVAAICIAAPHLFGVSPENFGPLKKFIWTGGLIGIVWFGHEMHYSGKKDRSA